MPDAGLAANMLLGAWWLDGVVALGIASWAASRRPAGVGREIVAAHASQMGSAYHSRLAILPIDRRRTDPGKITVRGGAERHRVRRFVR